MVLVLGYEFSRRLRRPTCNAILAAGPFPGASKRMSPAVLPAFFMAVLACWLGLSLLVRAPRDRPTQAFAWLCLHLTLYGLTIVLPDLTDAASVRYVLELIQLVETVLLPAVFFHFIMVLVGDGPAPLWQYAALIAGYASGLAQLAGYALFGALDAQPDGTLLFPPPLLLPWTLQRAVPMLMALLLMFLSYRQRNRRRPGSAAASAIRALGCPRSDRRAVGDRRAQRRLLARARPRADGSGAGAAGLRGAGLPLAAAPRGPATFYRSLLGGI